MKNPKPQAQNSLPLAVEAKPEFQARTDQEAPVEVEPVADTVLVLLTLTNPVDPVVDKV